ncbi:aspartyl/glutamyl-tRNA amidotransferase subunit A [Candidatus Berkelbacteria bacterium RIFOXYA2_FULL_43_10]|uniref:Glutamyl-tRNA(Gln) amidotransferase subunit A n=1 Tax=Candidatus Berkelbacteria bacterium RIFOXYA2_FULL_43_10 TaxID=1797472 RepID=A0A1F5EDT8_9BACT|nr:MAG: aspartyl/glutamyl-tRNA amidotransferase subunit A [Candidatus Berkelbacteria bacterium RIFOXYA2_FULL_43_10]
MADQNSKLYQLTLKKASEKLKSGEISSLDLTKAVFERIETVEPKVGAFITLTKELALKQAKESDKRRVAEKTLSEIDGIPIAVKDLFCTKDVRTTAASKILDDFIPTFESTATQKLWDAGAVLIGKTNCDQFAMGSSTETSAYKETKNPWDLKRVPGGSSGGSAAAVSADMCMAALGTDTGGSIRQPASLCSIVGLKPTYGRVSRYGVIAMASSLDCIGPMTKTVEDAAILLNILAGEDESDGTTLPIAVPDYQKSLDGNIKGLKIGIPKEFFGEGMDPEVDKIVREGISKLKNLGANIVEVSLPTVKYALAVYYVIMPAEVASNLARYDGVRYGHSKAKSEKRKAKSLEELYIDSRTEGFGDEAKRRIMLGNYVLSSGYYDAYYKKAQQVRTLVKRDFEEAFRKVDILATPVSPTAAFKFGEKSGSPLEMYLSDIHTVPINPAGVPAISVPAGFTSNNLPVGMQLIAPQMGEEKLLNVANQFEKIAGITNIKPEL